MKPEALLILAASAPKEPDAVTMADWENRFGVDYPQPWRPEENSEWLAACRSVHAARFPESDCQLWCDGERVRYIRGSGRFSRPRRGIGGGTSLEIDSSATSGPSYGRAVWQRLWGMTMRDYLFAAAFATVMAMMFVYGWTQPI